MDLISKSDLCVTPIFSRTVAQRVRGRHSGELFKLEADRGYTQKMFIAQECVGGVVQWTPDTIESQEMSRYLLVA